MSPNLTPVLILPTDAIIQNLVRSIASCPQSSYVYNLEELISEATTAIEYLNPEHLVTASDVMFDKLTRNHNAAVAEIMSKAFFEFGLGLKQVYMYNNLYESNGHAPYYFRQLQPSTNNIMVARYQNLSHLT